MTSFARGKWALGICDRCGFEYKLDELQKLVINREEVGLKVCPECWEADHPQNDLGRFPVVDPQALYEPRSDTAERESSREISVPGDITVEEYIAQKLYLQ